MKLTILGASGHGKVVADIARLCGYDEIYFLDDNETVKLCGIYPVIGKTREARRFNNDIFIAIGNAEIRRRMLSEIENKRIPILIHPSSVVSNGVKIGRGSVVMAGAVINPGTVIGTGCIINTSSSIDHDCRIDDYVHVSVGAHLCGTVNIKEMTWIGAGATISNNVNICSKCMIGAGAVVIRDIKEAGTYVGVPAGKV